MTIMRKQQQSFQIFSSRSSTFYDSLDTLNTPQGILITYTLEIQYCQKFGIIVYPTEVIAVRKEKLKSCLIKNLIENKDTVDIYNINFEIRIKLTKYIL